jgi:hypothetical protein
MKFYLILVWNDETHKVNRVIIGFIAFLVPSCIGRSSENIFNSTTGVQKKKERQDETQCTTEIGGKN